MLGWLLFQSATDLSIPVTQDQKVKFTGPLEVPLLLELEPPPQAAREIMSTSARLTKAGWSAKRRIQGNEEIMCISCTFQKGPNLGHRFIIAVTVDVVAGATDV